MNKSKRGVYKIECSVTQKRYVGSSGDIYKRWYDHRLALRKNVHHSAYLQRSWNRHGEEHFQFSVLEECDKAVILEREQFWIDELKPEYNCSNKAVVAQYWVETQLPRRAAITHCPYGHIYDEVNTMVHQGKRVCRRCNRERVAKIYHNETPEQREIRRRRVSQYHDRTRIQNNEKMRLYASIRKEQKREYDRKRYEALKEKQ